MPLASTYPLESLDWGNYGYHPEASEEDNR